MGKDNPRNSHLTLVPDRDYPGSDGMMLDMNVLQNQFASTLSAEETASNADRLNNILTGVALRSGVLESCCGDEKTREQLRELHDLAIEAVTLTRTLLGLDRF